MTTTHDSNLKDLLKSAGLKMSTLAESLGMEYSHVATVFAMDSRGEEPKRPSVRRRRDAIREHLEVLLAVGVKESALKLGGGLWASPAEAARRFPAPPGASQSFEYGDLALGGRVRLQLDPDGAPEVFRFLRVVERDGREPYADLFSLTNGAMRSVRLSEIETGRRTR